MAEDQARRGDQPVTTHPASSSIETKAFWYAYGYFTALYDFGEQLPPADRQSPALFARRYQRRADLLYRQNRAPELLNVEEALINYIRTGSITG